VIESEIPGLTSFGSAYSSARGHAGICKEHDRFMDPMRALPIPRCQTNLIRNHKSVRRSERAI
jgi:hypothetical protein